MRRIALGRCLIIVSLLTLMGCRSSTTSPNTSSSPSAATATAASGSPNATADPGGQNSPEPSAAAAPVAPRPIPVPAGTSMVVTVDQTISSRDNNPGDRFDASLAEPVVVGNRVVIPKGARASGTILDAKSAGRFRGNAAITVALTSVRVNGEEYRLKTSEVTESSKGRAKRTAEGAGGGAVVGALIGALAGGGRGAAIGAGAGAGAGTAGTALTGSRNVTIAPETRLHFRLEEPLKINRS